MTMPEAPSNATPPRSRMTLVGERRFPDPPQSDPPAMTVPSGGTTPKLTTTETTPPSYQAYRAGMLGALNFATAVLGVRLILLVSVLGASGLTFLVLRDPDPYRLVALATYGVLVVLPVVYLAGR